MMRDILPQSPAADTARADAQTPHFKREPSGGDFASAMKQALAPPAETSPDRPVARAASPPHSRKSNPSPPPAKNFAAPADLAPADAADPEISPAAKAVKSAPAEAKKKSDDEVTVGFAPVPEPSVPLPMFLTYPLAGQFSLSLPAPEPTNSAASSGVPAVAALAGGGANVPQLLAATAAASGSLVGETVAATTPAISPAPSLVEVLAAEPGVKNSGSATPQNTPPDNSPAGFVLSPTLFTPVAAAPTVADAVVGASEAAAQAELTAALPADGRGDAAGTGVATTDFAMKKSAKTNKVAGLDVQVLPGAGQETSRETVLQPRLAVAAVRATENRSADFTPAFPLGETTLPLPTVAAAFNTVELPALTDARLRAVERAHDMVTLHAMRLVESKSDVLSVVIKPAVGTELTLELRQREGGVEAHAVLSRGDYQFLNQHWPDLQQRLEQRGIKLAPLGGEAGFSSGNQQQRSAREEAAQEAAVAFAEFAAIGGATARRAMSLNGWESWA